MMKKMHKKAFTLIELLVVIAVVGILVLLGAPRFTGYTQKAELIRIQHDTKVMEEEIGTVLINNDDEFNKWENNMKDLNQLAQEDKLFEKEGFATDVDDSHLVANRTVDLRKHASQLEPPNKTNLNVGGELYELSEGLSISETYKVIPERYKDKINSELKGTFYANSDGKVYYEHVKSLSRILTAPEEEPVLEGPIPIATAEELNNVRNATVETYGAGTQWEGLYEGGLDKEYIQVADIDLSEYSEKEEGWNPIGTYAEFNNSEPFTGIYDGGNYVITGLEVKGDSNKYQGLFGLAQDATIRNVGLIENKATGFQVVGGLVGAATSSTISNSYATGEIEGRQWVGGLVGRLTSSTIENSHATGLIKGGSKVNGSGTSMGGLVGSAGTSWNLGDTEIRNSYFTGSIETTGSQIGGLVGSTGARTTVSNSYATGSVNGAEELGGLVGMASSSTINNSYFEGSATGTGEGRIRGHIYIGGLVGVSGKSTIENSYAKGSVTATGKSINRNTDKVYVGGLVGHDSYKNNIINSYAEGSVTGSGEGTGQYSVPVYAGGLVGYAEYDKTTIENSYATGPVTGTGTGKVVINVGGLVGRAYAGNNASSIVTINNSYATGPVTVTDKGVAGGLVGSGDSIPINIKNSYWDINTTGQTSSHEGGIGLATDEMKNQAIYEGWDFTNIWEITPGNYPTLR